MSNLFGKRIRLIRDVERFPDFIAKTGMTGYINNLDQRNGRFFVSARMDETIEGAEAWDNEIWWEESHQIDFEKDVELI